MPESYTINMENKHSGSSELKLLSATSLKLIAAASMLVDHIGAVLFPGYKWLRIVGRIAMPIFCFCIAESLRHTRNRAGFMLRIAVFALISEYPFDIALKGQFSLKNTQNVMFTFLFAIAGIWAFEYVKERAGSLAGGLAACLAAVMLAAAADMLKTDYGTFGVTLVYLFYFLRPDMPLRLGAAALYITAARWKKLQLYCLLAFPIIALYNGERGKDLKYFFYIFYPGHLLILYLIKILT